MTSHQPLFYANRHWCKEPEEAALPRCRLQTGFVYSPTERLGFNLTRQWYHLSITENLPIRVHLEPNRSLKGAETLYIDRWKLRNRRNKIVKAGPREGEPTQWKWANKWPLRFLLVRIHTISSAILLDGFGKTRCGPDVHWQPNDNPLTSHRQWASCLLFAFSPVSRL